MCSVYTCVCIYIRIGMCTYVHMYMGVQGWHWKFSIIAFYCIHLGKGSQLSPEPIHMTSITSSLCWGHLSSGFQVLELQEGHYTHLELTRCIDSNSSSYIYMPSALPAVPSALFSNAILNIKYSRARDSSWVKSAPRTKVWFPAVMWKCTTAFNSSSRGVAISPQASAQTEISFVPVFENIA